MLLSRAHTPHQAIQNDSPNMLSSKWPCRSVFRLGSFKNISVLSPLPTPFSHDHQQEEISQHVKAQRIPGPGRQKETIVIRIPLMDCLYA